jgi:putrescine transport system ATP-binding protein
MPDDRNRTPIKGDDQAQQRPWENGAARPFVRIEGLSKHFDGLPAVDNVSLDIYKGELFAILGGSGCGKTTLLRMLAGFETPSAGRIMLDGVDLTDVPPYDRPVNLMFQSYALFPHMTVEENIGYGLKKEGVPKAETAARVAEMLEMVQMSGFAGRRPHQLSGGQRQRVALARALVKRPKLLLLDEPLAALDKKLREHTQFELMNIQYKLGVTFIVVTHDQEEAMTLASRIAVMDQGRFVQIGTPTEVYEYPASRFVADFFGTINLFAGTLARVEGDTAVIESEAAGAPILARHREDTKVGDAIWVAVRPEKISIAKEPPSSGGGTVLKGVVWDLAYYGNLSLYRVKTESGTIIQVSAQNRIRSARRVVEWDEHVYLSWDSHSSVVLKE